LVSSEYLFGIFKRSLGMFSHCVRVFYIFFARKTN
jgi:hypothetical protein